MTASLHHTDHTRLWWCVYSGGDDASCLSEWVVALGRNTSFILFLFFPFLSHCKKYISRKQHGIWQQMKHWLPLGYKEKWNKERKWGKAGSGFGPASYGLRWNFELVVEVGSFQLPYFSQANTGPELLLTASAYINLTLDKKLPAGEWLHFFFSWF